MKDHIHIKFSLRWLTLTMLVVAAAMLHGCKKDKKVQREVPTGTISGMVLSDQGIKLSGVRITLSDEKKTNVYSDTEGKFRFEQVAVGNYSLMASKEKYISDNKTTSVEENQTSGVTFSMKVGEPTLLIDKQKLDMSWGGGAGVIELQSNSAWMVTGTTDWLSVDAPSGAGDRKISLNAKQNLSDSLRTAIISFTCGNITRTLEVVQLAKIRLLSVSLTHPISDQVILTFSSPVDEVLITSKYELCQSTITYGNKPMSREVRFKYPCGRLGLSYPFQVIAKDRLESYTINFDVDFFSKRVVTPAVWSQGPPTYFVTDDNQAVWFSIFDSKVIQKIDMKTFEVEKTYPVDFKVRKLVYNPYNRLIYILTNTPDIYVMDPRDGRIVKDFRLQLLDGDNSVYPTIYPRYLAFTASGLGALICGSNISSATSWKMIDSRRDDLVFYPRHKDKNFEYGKVEVNFDRTKLLIKAAFSNLLFSYDPVGDVVTDIKIPIQGALGWVVPNKKNESLFYIQTYEQYIYNPQNNYQSFVTYLSNGCAADFSYRPGEQEIMYVFDTSNKFQLLDYKTQKTLHTFPTIDEFYYGKPIATTDGKYLVTFTNYTLFRFDTELFSLGGSTGKSAARVGNAFVR